MPRDKFSLSREMNENPIIVGYLSDVEIAKDFYRAMCNMRWKKHTSLDEADQIVDILKGDDSLVWSCSWRTSGGIIADIRNTWYNTNEDYMDFYCAGWEGKISPLVRECFNNMDWYESPWPDDNDGELL
jgi:hypothetical protein